MTDSDSPPVDPLLGASLDDAVEGVLDREYGKNVGDVRATLDSIATDGTVSSEAIEAEVEDAAEHVAVVGESLETARDALDAAREAVAPVEDLGAVQSRLGPLEARYENVEEAVNNLRARHESLVERSHHPKDVHDLAVSIRELKQSVRPAYERVEQFRHDAEAFETWASDPSVRYDELGDDADYVRDLLDGLDAAADNIESDDTDGDVAEAWAEAALQRRVASLLLTDLRAELSDLENWPADVGGGSGEGADASDVAERLEKFGERESALAARLDALGRDEWQERFADRLDAFEDDLDAFDPPVPWGAVLETFSEHQAALGE